MSWILFNEGRRRPFRSQLARLVWALIIGFFSGFLAVLMGMGFLEAVGSGGRIGDALIFGFFAAGLAAAAVVCGVAAVQAIRAISRSER